MSNDLNHVKSASKALLTAALEQKAEHIQVFDQVMSMGTVQLALDKMGPLDPQNIKYFALVGSSYTDLVDDPDFSEATALSDKESAEAGLLGITDVSGVQIPIISDYKWCDEDTVLPPNCLYVMAISDTSVVGSVCVHLTPLTWHYPSKAVN